MLETRLGTILVVTGLLALLPAGSLAATNTRQLASPPEGGGAGASASGSLSIDRSGVNARGEVEGRRDLRFEVDERGRIQTTDGSLSDAIHFETDSAELGGDAETREVLEALADFLKQYPEVRVSIEGHTDSRGTDRRNQRLSEDRALTLKGWFERAGVDASRVEYKGLGESSPSITEPAECRNSNAEAAPTSCESHWQKNRRVEFVIVGGRDTVTGSGGGGGPGDAFCGDPQDRSGFQRGLYLYLAPGLFASPMYDHSFPRARGLSWQGSVGFGYLFDPHGAFRAALGVGAELMPTTYEVAGACADETTGDDRCDGAFESRIDLELRLGGGNPRVWGYGLLAPGVAIGTTSAGSSVGADVGLGAGLQGIIGKKGFFLGGEVGVDLMFFGSGRRLYSGPNHNLDLKFLLGWHFGYANRPRP